MAIRLGGTVDHLTIEPDFEDIPTRHGATQILWDGDRFTDREIAIREIQVALAGPVAEMIYSGDQYHPELLAEWQQDWEMATERASRHLPPNTSLASYLSQITVNLIRTFERGEIWAAIAALADELEAHESLEQEDVEAVLEAWPVV